MTIPLNYENIRATVFTMPYSKKIFNLKLIQRILFTYPIFGSTTYLSIKERRTTHRGGASLVIFVRLLLIGLVEVFLVDVSSC